jgi:hypothetical protein
MIAITSRPAVKARDGIVSETPGETGLPRTAGYPFFFSICLNPLSASRHASTL